MAKTSKTRSLNNDRGQLKGVLPKELTEKLRNYVDTHTVSELRDRLDALKKASVLDTLNQMAAKEQEQLYPLNKASTSSMTVAEVASKALLSFNLYPMKSFESSLKNINYPTSIEHALARDWQNVGNDLWKSYLKVSGSQLSDNDE